MSHTPTTETSLLVRLLPTEFKMQIAAQMDGQSGCNLALACRALRNMGEKAIYQDIDLASGWSDNTITMSYDQLASDIRIAASKLSDKARKVYVALLSSPIRRHFVTSLRLEPFDGHLEVGAQSMIDILSLVSSSLRNLAIVPRSIWDEWLFFHVDPTCRHERFYAKLNNTQTKFPNLIHLKYAFPADSAGRRPATWLAKLHGLKQLELEVPRGCVTPTIPLLEPRPFQSLTRLTIIDMDEEECDKAIDLLVVIAGMASSLERLYLDGYWRKSEAAEEAVAGLKDLKVLALTDSRDYDHHCDWWEFGPIGPARGIQQFAPMIYEMDENKALRNFVELYRMQDLRQLTMIAHRSDNPLSLILLPPPKIPTGISHRFLSNLRTAPSLISTLFLSVDRPFPKIHHPSFTTPDLFVPIHRWESGGHRGFILRHYRNSDGDELWHRRALRQIEEAKDASEGTDAGRHWETSTHFQGATVPRDVLEAVYRTTGEEVDFMEGGRDLKMGEGAWVILRDWRGTAEDDGEDLRNSPRIAVRDWRGTAEDDDESDGED